MLATALAVGLRWVMDPWLGSELGLVTSFAAVAAVAWLGGRGPAILATVAGYLACDLLFIEPRGAIGPADPSHLLGLFAYLLSCSLIIVLAEAYRRYRRDTLDRQRLLTVTLASIGDAVVTTDPLGRVTNLNPVAVSLTGWPVAEAIGKPLETIFRALDEQTRRPIDNPALRALREGAIVGLANHTVLIAKDGVERAIDDSAAPIVGDDGKVEGCVLVFRDVTERRRAEQAVARNERELADFFEHAPMAMHWVGADGVILRANRAELELLGYSREELVGRPVADFHVDRPTIEGVLEDLRAGKTVTGQAARLRCKDGSVRDVIIHSSPLIENGVFLHSRCLTVDVTGPRQLQETQARLAAIVADSDDAIVSKTLEGVIQSWNEGAERLLGYSADEVLGQSINLIVPPELRDEEKTILERLRRGERIHHFETVRVRKDGRRIDISLTVSPVRDEEGRVIGASKVARDITQRKRSEEALRDSRERERERVRELDAVLRTTPVAIMIAHDPGCEVVTGNPTAHELHRLAEGENLSAASAAPDRLPFFEDRKGEPLRSEEMPLRIAASRGIEVRDVELDLVFEEGARRHIYGNAAPLRAADGTPVGAVAAFMDITALEEAQRALNEADRRKDEFLATLAHELRNPLAPIRSSLEILGRGDLAPERAEEARETIDRQVSHLVRLVDDLLDVSRITRGNLRLRKARVELEPLIRQAIETCRPLLDFARQTVEIVLPERPLYLEADPVRLTQVFGNLLQNACKYSEEGASITIAAEVRSSRIAISVTDRGVGIPADKLDVIFEMFSQVGEAAEDPRGGLGIGLTLVKRLVELHGGVVSAHSEGQGRGSVFVVELPLARAPASTPAPAPVPTREKRGTAKRRILVVDDNRDSVRSLATLLDIEGHEIFTAYDGLEAVEQAERARPGVILLDVGLPGINGHEACRRIREQPWGHDMVIIAITGWGQDNDRRRSQEAGFDHHLVKPIDVGFLLEQLGSSALTRDSSWMRGATSRRQGAREATPES
ncbi:MAG TPA: PAS domain S-box protein [Thermoanaerobaculia bacterium]|nr:PAS domain S-box protein [Thermoanaerobaculia bacterium]